MFDWASKLQATQLSPMAEAVQKQREPLPKAAILDGLRRRNALLDGLFYDIGVITHSEALSLSPWLAAEGAIVMVPPSNEGTIAVYNSVDEFVAAGGGNVTQLAIAGVGSSALGSAAFARNVADATGKPVVAVVSGYGLADVVTEAFGGYFWFGALNGIRHEVQVLDDLTASLDAERIEAATDPGTILVRMSHDTRTVLQLLRDERFAFDLLTGHSKGNLVLSEALFELVRTDHDRASALAKAARIITVSAIIEMPRHFRGIVDVVGAWDWFGRINSRIGIPPDVVVPSAWHHTNTELPAHLPVTPVFRDILRSTTH